MKNLIEENWETLNVGGNRYDISSLGRVKSFAKQTEGKILKSSVNSSGYECVSISVNGKMVSRTVHSLVAQAFLGHAPNGWNSVVDHIDGNRLNNKSENLQIISQRENCTKDKVLGNYTSKHIGVHFSSKDKKYGAAIRYNGKKIFLGLHTSEELASELYQKALCIINEGGEFVEYLIAELREDAITELKGIPKGVKVYDGKKRTTYRVVYKGKKLGTFYTAEQAENVLKAYRLEQYKLERGLIN